MWERKSKEETVEKREIRRKRKRKKGKYCRRERKKEYFDMQNRQGWINRDSWEISRGREREMGIITIRREKGVRHITIGGRREREIGIEWEIL